MPKTLSLLAVLKKVDAKGVKSLSNAQWDTFLASDTEPNEIQEKIKKLEGYEEKGVTYDATGDLIVEDNNAMIERFRQRTGRAAGRESLKVKRSKIDVASFKNDFLGKKSDSALATISEPPPALGAGEEETEGLKGIRDVLDEILGVLRLDFKDDRKEARDRKKEDDKKKRTKKEDKLEGGVKKSIGLIGKSLKAIVSPFSNIWDAVFKFLQSTLLNVLFVKTLDWFGDPKNQKKAERIGKFFKDWWPALAAAGALFLTPLGALLNGMVGLLTAIIPKLVMAIAANPWAATAVLGGVALWGLSKKIGNMQGGDGGDGGDEKVEMNGGGLVHKFNEGGEVPDMGMRTSSFSTGTGATDADRLGTHSVRTLSPGEAKEFLAERGMPSMELMDGTVVPDFGKMGADKFMSGVQIVREGLTDPKAIAQLDEFMATNPFAQPDELQRVINRVVPGSQAQVMGDLGDDISAKLRGFNKGGGVPGSGNKDTVPAMLTPGEFVMSKGAVNKYGMDTLENMNAAAGSGSSSKKDETVPSMLTPGEFVVSAPAVQKFGVNTLESMNLKGGGNNKPELSVGANKGGLINNYNLQYKGGGSVPQGWKRWLAGAADFATGGIFDFDKRGSMVDGMQRMRDKGSVDTPKVQITNKTITLPTIPKDRSSETTTSKNDIPEFRISMISTQRSMVISSLGIQDLIGG